MTNSPGGGGVTFERKVAADYLVRLLLGHGAVGLGPSRVVVSVAFQQAPEFTVDDLVVGAAMEGEDEPSLVLAVEARRTPNVVDCGRSGRGGRDDGGGDGMTTRPTGPVHIHRPDLNPADDDRRGGLPEDGRRRAHRAARA